jgi:hypothetical protein
MLASTRDQELERLLYEADKAGIPDERFNLLQAKRLIVQASSLIRTTEKDWQDKASDMDNTINNQIALIKDPSLKGEALMALGKYYREKTRRLESLREKAVASHAEDETKNAFTKALEANPYLIEAVRELIDMKASKEEITKRLQKIIDDKSLPGKDEKYKEDLSSAISRYWETFGDGLKLDRNIVDYFGDVSPPIVIRLIESAFRNGFLKLIPKLIPSRIRSVGEATAIVDAINRQLAALRFTKLKEIPDFISTLNQFILPTVLPNPETRALGSKLLITRAYINIGAGKFSLAAENLRAAERSDRFAKSETALARAKILIARRSAWLMKGGWWWITRKLSAKGKEIVSADRAEAYKPAATEVKAEETKAEKEEKVLTDSQKIRKYEKALFYNLRDLDTHKKLKELYDKTGQRGEALYRIIAITELLRDSSDYSGARVYYIDEYRNSKYLREYENNINGRDLLAGLMKDINDHLKPAVSVSPDHGAIMKGMSVEEVRTLIGENPEDIKSDLVQELNEISKRFGNVGEDLNLTPEVRNKVLELAKTRGIDMITAIKQARNDLLAGKRLIKFNAIVRGPDQYALGVATPDNVLGYSREILGILREKQDLLLEFLFHEAICYQLSQGNPEEGHQIARQVQMILFPKNYPSGMPQVGGRPELTGSLTVELRKFIDRKAPTVMIGITGKDVTPAVIGKLSQTYPGVIFIPLGELAGKEAVEGLRVKPGNAMVRVVLDIGKIDDVTMTKIDSIINASQIQSFVLMYPYLAGLDKKSLSDLSRNTLERLFDIIKATLPQVQSLDLDRYFVDQDAIIDSMKASSPAEPKDYRRIKAELNVPIIGEEDYYEWVRVFTKAIEEKADDRLAVLQFDLMKYLSDKPVDEIKRILAEHEGIAIAQRWESEDRASFCSELLTQLDGKIVNVLAFNAKALESKATQDNLIALAKAVGNRSYAKIVIFRNSNDKKIEDLKSLMPNAIEVLIEEGKGDLSVQIRNKIVGLTNAADVRIGIVETRSLAESFGDIVSDLSNKDVKMVPSYVVVNSDKTAAIGEINLANLVNAAIRGGPCFIALGFEKGTESRFAIIQDILAGMNGWFKMITDVGKAVSEILMAIKATSTSV